MMVASMAEALNQAQTDVFKEWRISRALLRVRIQDEARRFPKLNGTQLAQRLSVEVHGTLNLSHGLFHPSEEFVHLERAAEEALRDMKNSSQKDDAGVQMKVESHALCGARDASKNEGEAIQSSIERQDEHGPSPSFPDRDGGVHRSDESQCVLGAAIPTPIRSGEVHGSAECHHSIGPSAAALNWNDAVQKDRESQIRVGRVVPMTDRQRVIPTPNPPRGVEASRIAYERTTRTIFDYELASGRSLGSVKIGELDFLETQFAKDESKYRRSRILIGLMKEAVGGHGNPDITMAEIFSATKLESLLQRAAELSDVAA